MTWEADGRNDVGGWRSKWQKKVTWYRESGYSRITQDIVSLQGQKSFSNKIKIFPDHDRWEDIIYKLYVREKIEKALENTENKKNFYPNDYTMVKIVHYRYWRY